MFKTFQSAVGDTVEIVINGKPLRVSANLNVAAALLLHDKHCRTTVVSGARRGPFCMMGVCFDCLVEINGLANQQACIRQVENGMEVRWQQGAVTTASGSAD